MARTETTTMERDPVSMTYDGVTYWTEREVTRVDDWITLRFPDGQEIPFNRGHVSMGRRTWHPRDPRPAVLKPVASPKRWWQIWR